MKTQISKNSFDVTKKYTGVYMQQGRMILDSDWNEQVDITKDAIDNSLIDLIGNGIPQERGISLGVESNTLCVKPGTVYISGKRITLDEALDLRDQSTLLDDSEYEFILETSEESITSTDEESLKDSALYGADTCTRTQRILSFYASPVKAESVNLEKKQKPTLSVNLLGNSLSTDIPNGLLRVELEKVGDDFLVKISTDNGAEIVKKGQTSSHYVYESIDQPSEDNRFVSADKCNVAKTYREWNAILCVTPNGSISDEKSLLGNSVTSHAEKDGNLTLILLNALGLTIELSGKHFSSGDYWQVPIRSTSTTDRKSLLEKQIPIEIRKDQIVLAKGTLSDYEDYIKSGRYDFSAIHSLKATDVAYSVDMTVEEKLNSNATAININAEKIEELGTQVETFVTEERTAERLALFGKGIISGFIPDMTSSFRVDKKISLAFTQQGGALINGRGELLSNCNPEPAEFSLFDCFYDGVVVGKKTGSSSVKNGHQGKEKQTKGQRHYQGLVTYKFIPRNKVVEECKKYGITCSFFAPIKQVELYTKEPQYVLSVLSKYATFSLSNKTTRGKERPELNPMTLVESILSITYRYKKSITLPVYLDTSGSSVNTVVPLFHDTGMGVDDTVALEKELSAKSLKEEMLWGKNSKKAPIYAKQEQGTLSNGLDARWDAILSLPAWGEELSPMICAGTLEVTGTTFVTGRGRYWQLSMSPEGREQIQRGSYVVDDIGDENGNTSSDNSGEHDKDMQPIHILTIKEDSLVAVPFAKTVQEALPFVTSDGNEETNMYGVTQTYSTDKRVYVHVESSSETELAKAFYASSGYHAVYLILDNFELSEKMVTNINYCRTLGISTFGLFVQTSASVSNQSVEKGIKALEETLQERHIKPESYTISVGDWELIQEQSSDVLGLPSLTSLISEMDKKVPAVIADVDKPFFMPIEDVFTIAGRGTVLTGLIRSGSLIASDELELVGIKKRPKKVTCSEVEQFRKIVDKGVAGENVGVIFKGLPQSSAERGMVLAAPGTIQAHTIFDALVYFLTKDEGGGGEIPESIEIYLNTANVTAELQPNVKPKIGVSSLLRLRLQVPFALNVGTHFDIKIKGSAAGIGVITWISK